MSTSPHLPLMLATEHGEFDTGAEALAFALARRHAVPLPAVLPLQTNPEYELVAPQLVEREEAAAASRLDELERKAEQAGVRLLPVVRRGPEPYIEIVEEAQALGSALIVIRRRGRRGLLANLMIGEMVSKVVAHAPCSVLIAPRAARLWSQGVLVGIDPLHPDRAPLAQARRLAADHALPLHAVAVATQEAGRAAAEQVLAEQLRGGSEPPGGRPASGEVRVGHPHAELMAAARTRGADLVVVARRGAQSLAHAWIGGVTQKVVGLAECPVLIHVGPPAT